MGRTLSEFLCLADSCQSNIIFRKLDGIFILLFLFLVDFEVRSLCFVLNCVCIVTYNLFSFYNLTIIFSAVYLDIFKFIIKRIRSYTYDEFCAI